MLRFSCCYRLFTGQFSVKADVFYREYWKSLQTCSVVHDDAESQYFYNGRTGVALSTKKFLNYFAMQRDKSRSCGIPNTNDLIEPVLSEDFLTITDFALAKKMELIEELKGRNNPLSLLPAGPVFFDDSDLILKSCELSEAYKDIKTFLEHFVRLTSDYFVSPKPRDPMGEIIWGLPRKPNKESDTSEVEKSTRRVAPLEITINGVPIGSDFSTYVAQKRSETVQNKTEVRKTEPLKEEPRVWLPQNDRDSTVLISTPCSRIDDVCQRFEKYFLERVNSSECVHPLVPGSVSEAVEKHTEYLEEKELYSAAENIKKHRNPTSKDEVEQIAEKNGVRNNAGEKPEKIEVKSVDLNPLHGLEDTSFGTHPHPLEGNLDPVAFNTSGPYPEDAVEDVDAELEDDFGKESTNHKLPWNRISIPVATEKPTKAPAKKGQKKVSMVGDRPGLVSGRIHGQTNSHVNEGRKMQFYWFHYRYKCSLRISKMKNDFRQNKAKVHIQDIRWAIKVPVIKVIEVICNEILLTRLWNILARVLAVAVLKT